MSLDLVGGIDNEREQMSIRDFVKVKPIRS